MRRWLVILCMFVTASCGKSPEERSPRPVEDTVRVTGSTSWEESVPPWPESAGVGYEEDPFAGLDGILDSLSVGYVAFEAPARMNLGETALVRLTLGMDQTAILGIDAVIHDETRVSRRMRASLTGPVTAITPEEQPVSRVELNEWLWELKPDREGTAALYLALSVLVEVEGFQTKRAIKTLDRVVIVDVRWTRRAGVFWENNWQWLWATLLAPAALWWWRRKIKKQ